jgi:hypothetical protein
LRKTRRLPEHERTEAVNILLGGHGVEAIRGNWQNGYWCDVLAVYVNLGGIYAHTVIQIRGETSFSRSRFFCGSLGDFVERNSKRYGIQ